MKLSALIARPVRDNAGRMLGRLQEIHAIDGKVIELVYGPTGLFERLTGRVSPTTVPWARVARVNPKGIALK